MIPVFSVKAQEPGIITRARFSPAVEDHRAMCISSCGTLTLIDLQAIKYTTKSTYERSFDAITGFYNYLLDFSFTADGRIVFIGDSFGNLSVDTISNIGKHVTAKRGSLISVKHAHDGGVFTVTPSPIYEFLVYTGGGDGMIRVWDTRFMVPDNPLLAYKHKSESTEADDGGDTPAKKPLHEMWANKNAVSSICFPDKNLMLSSGIDENVRLWDTCHNSVIATIRSYGAAMGIWDVVMNRALGRIVIAGQSTDVWAFYLKDFVCGKEPGSYEIAPLDVEDREPRATTCFSRWRRICTYGKNVIVPTLNSKMNAKVFILDAATGSEIYRLTTDIVDRVHTVDTHPIISSGLLLTGGVFYIEYCSYHVMQPLKAVELFVPYGWMNKGCAQSASNSCQEEPLLPLNIYITNYEQKMKTFKEGVIDALTKIQDEEAEVIQDFHHGFKELVSDLHSRLDGLADRRLEVLTRISSQPHYSSQTVNTVDIQSDLNEMSLKEIAGVSRTVDESYQQNGTAAWPNFWLHALMGCAITRNRISTVDRQLLSYLRDIRCRDTQPEEPVDSFEIELIFAENPFFNNKTMKRSFTILNNEEVESQSTPIDWKDNAVELIEELSVTGSDADEEGQNIASNQAGSFFDFFQPFEDVYFDLKVAKAIKERILRNPLEYALRYENLKLKGEIEDSEPEDEEESQNKAVGGRYPFSWLLSLATCRPFQ